MIPEHFLREIWKAHDEFLVQPLMLADGSPLEILSTGTENLHRGGPDFLGARIAMDGLVVSGDVELHRTTSGWQEHGHEQDAHYANVVLHVVLNDEESTDGTAAPRAPRIPTLAL